MCRMIEKAAREHGLQADFLTRLIWRESSFRANAVSPAGAQGVAQFMPGTAAERGLRDPFDPEQAIPKSAHLLAELNARFGNIGLAAAAYNGGPARVDAWLAGQGNLPAETRNYVVAVTGRTAEDWAALRNGHNADTAPAKVSPSKPHETCLTVVASVRRGTAPPLAAASGAIPVTGPFAPWGVQLAGNFSKAAALASYRRAAAQNAAILGDVQPMVIGTRLRFRGTSAFWRVRVPAQTRAAAETLCARLHKAGGNCVVLKS